MIQMQRTSSVPLLVVVLFLLTYQDCFRRRRGVQLAPHFYPISSPYADGWAGGIN